MLYGQVLKHKNVGNTDYANTNSVEAVIFIQKCFPGDYEHKNC